MLEQEVKYIKQIEFTHKGIKPRDINNAIKMLECYDYNVSRYKVLDKSIRFYFEDNTIDNVEEIHLHIEDNTDLKYKDRKCVN